jgi:hypothetical protein
MRKVQVETMGGNTTALDAFNLRFRPLESLSLSHGGLQRLLETQLDASRYIPHNPSSSSTTSSPPSLESFPLLLPRPLAKTLEPGSIRDQGLLMAFYLSKVDGKNLTLSMDQNSQL